MYNPLSDTSERFEVTYQQHSDGDTFSMPGIYTRMSLMIALFRDNQGKRLVVQKQDKWSEVWELQLGNKAISTFYLTNRDLGKLHA